MEYGYTTQWKTLYIFIWKIKSKIHANEMDTYLYFGWIFRENKNMKTYSTYLLNLKCRRVSIKKTLLPLLLLLLEMCNFVIYSLFAININKIEFIRWTENVSLSQTFWMSDRVYYYFSFYVCCYVWLASPLVSVSLCAVVW